jgi:hypothetical protein
MFLMFMLLTQITFCRAVFVFLHLSLLGLIGTKTDYHHVEKPMLWEVFLSKLIQLSQGNYVQDAASSNIAVFLWSDTCISSSQLNRPLE